MSGLIRKLDWQLTPLEALARWPMDRRVIMLHSGRPHPKWSRYSILAQSVGAIRFHQSQTQTTGDITLPTRAFQNHPLADLRTIIKADRGQSLWLGYLGYDTARWIEKLPSNAIEDRAWPTLQFERCTGYLVHDALRNLWTAHGTYVHEVPELCESKRSDSGYQANPPRPDLTREQHEQNVERTLDYIAAGDIFQANITQRFTSDFQGNPRSLYQSLATISPAWYGAYGELSAFNADEPKRILSSTSPELFLQLDHDATVTTRPIKGTRPASTNSDELKHSAKDTAELTMIIDLLRNDLGRVCDYGSVRITQHRTIETHPSIHHGVATIQGKLHRSKDLFDLLSATFPGGSITGAPKIRAMQIIDELEASRRGPYCGAIGMITPISPETCTPQSALDAARPLPRAVFNLAIRTMLIEMDTPTTGRIDFSVGGGIVADSVPADEYDESLDKARAMIEALATPCRGGCLITPISPNRAHLFYRGQS